jgi:hypothetical protein
MPVPTLTEWGRMRLESISFFTFVVLAAAVGVRWLWNVLARDFPRLPRLTYGKALAAVLLWGLAFVVVLTMIAGARELLTPGAWRREGLLYAVDRQPPPASDPQRTVERKEQIERLRTALWDYAARHQGAFPQADDASAAPTAVWEVPGGQGMRYLYVPGRNARDAAKLLAYEPALFGDERFALSAGGDVAILTSAELRRRLDGEKTR